MGTRHKERAKLLWLKRRVALDEAPYLVIDKLDGMYDDAFSLLLEAVKDKRLPAEINPETSWDLLDGDAEIIDSVDARKTTVATADLLTWLEPIISQLESQAEAPQVSTPHTAPASDPLTPASEPLVNGLTTAQIVEAFDGLVTFNLAKSMTDKAVWTHDARITSGTKGGRYKSLWNPVIMATALHERNNAPMPKLNQAFNSCTFLADWREEWNRYSKM
ncbi:hypothetical protein ACFDR9_002065 [Janthinobacterium sp. CG_23.3]|uniref:hypothetical protein n=1 Tax=Janthinobacterium sp. CG_23.3 TaxID=3349634 RepID=UPI0038D420A6